MQNSQFYLVRMKVLNESLACQTLFSFDCLLRPSEIIQDRNERTFSRESKFWKLKAMNDEDRDLYQFVNKMRLQV
jgi:hypothetical protein